MESWISNTEMCIHLGVHRNTLYKLRKKDYFAKGIHYRFKDPLNERSGKVWKRSAVDILLSSPDHVLRRRIKSHCSKNIGLKN